MPTATPVSSCRIAQQATTPFGFESFLSCPASKARWTKGCANGSQNQPARARRTFGKRRRTGSITLLRSARMSNIDWPWQLVVTVPKTRQLEPASGSTIILIGVIGLATLFACAIGYAMSRAIGAPMTQLLTNAQLARNGNIELMADVNAGSREIDEIDEILKEFATQRRRKGPLATTASASERSNNSG